MENLTTETFKTKIFNFDEKEKFEFNGERPTIIDFYAEWCGPCKTIAPILEELSSEYGGKIDIYKVNTENEQILTGIFNIRSIPSVLFIPMDGEPQMTTGALPKDKFKVIIKDILNVEI